MHKLNYGLNYIYSQYSQSISKKIVFMCCKRPSIISRLPLLPSSILILWKTDGRIGIKMDLTRCFQELLMVEDKRLGLELLFISFFAANHWRETKKRLLDYFSQIMKLTVLLPLAENILRYILHNSFFLESKTFHSILGHYRCFFVHRLLDEEFGIRL